MARPRKAGLSYFPLDVDILEADYRITDLYDQYGPRGFTVYIALLCMIYREGYYLEIPMQSLERQLGRVLGNRWFDKRILPEVIGFCGELGLFDKGLLQQGVLTSAGIQRRYQEATKRNKTQIRKYRLLEDNPPKAGESTPEKTVSETETPVFDAETPVSVAETAVSATNCVQRKEKERKQNKSKFSPWGERKGNAAGEKRRSPRPRGREKRTKPFLSAVRPVPERKIDAQRVPGVGGGNGGRGVPHRKAVGPYGRDRQAVPEPLCPASAMGYGGSGKRKGKAENKRVRGP